MHFHANPHKVCCLYRVEANAKAWQLVRQQEMTVCLPCKYKYISCLTSFIVPGSKLHGYTQPEPESSINLTTGSLSFVCFSVDKLMFSLEMNGNLEKEKKNPFNLIKL